MITLAKTLALPLLLALVALGAGAILVLAWLLLPELRPALRDLRRRAFATIRRARA